jgi:hypothetical protein
MALHCVQVCHREYLWNYAPIQRSQHWVLHNAICSGKQAGATPDPNVYLQSNVLILSLIGLKHVLNDLHIHSIASSQYLVRCWKTLFVLTWLVLGSSMNPQEHAVQLRVLMGKLP